MARFHTANSAEGCQQGFDCGGAGQDSDAGLDFVRSPNARDTIEGADPVPVEPFRVRGTPHGPSTFPQSFLVRPFDQDTAERFAGSHGVIARTPYGSVGEQTPWDQPRAVFRPVPQAWDAGYVRGAAG